MENMAKEAYYRTAIVALREGQWQDAARLLLTLEAERPGYRDISKVLSQLEGSRPEEFWRATFELAESSGDWEQAQMAVDKLTRISPGMSDLSEMRRRVTMAYHRSQSVTSPEEPVANQIQDTTATDDWFAVSPQDPSDWHKPAIEPDEDLIHTLELLAEEDNQPADSDSSDSEAQPPTDLPESAGIQHDAAAALEDILEEDGLVDEDTSPHEATDTRPYDLPEQEASVTENDTSPNPALIRSPQSDPEPVESRQLINEWPEVIPPSRSVPLITVHESSIQRVSRWILLLGAVLLAIVVAVAFLRTTQSGTGVETPQDIPSEGGSPTVLALPDFIEAIDRVLLLSQTDPASALEDLTALASAPIEAASDNVPLQELLEEWLSTVEETIVARLEMTESCEDTTSARCEAAENAVNSLALQSKRQRDQICEITFCPDS